MENEKKMPQLLLEASWEVCNKVGGIYTVIATKAPSLKKVMGDNVIYIGPDVWRSDEKNPDFIEDAQLFSDWQKHIEGTDIKVKCGRWGIPGTPIAFLVDFSTLIPQKDEIFTKFWELYQLDSLNGHWDYIESALFGYAVGKAIDSFTDFYYETNQGIVAQFHEWMTGTGVLYLKDKAPDISLIFTTHATVSGRCLAGNNKPLYDFLSDYNGNEVANMFNVKAKHSLEYNAANQAHVFTTVSDITAKECTQLLDATPNPVTPNGFDNSFVPEGEAFTEKKAIARGKLKQVAESLIGYELKEDTLFIGSSGRYEYRNKGIDVLMDSIKQINDGESIKRQICVFILIPANIFGPRTDLQAVLNGKASRTRLSQPYITHGIHDINYDPILNSIKGTSIDNGEEDQVKLIFVPSYLKGDDGIFNIPYYDLLIGLDLTVFPSYYEPWGYTPLESIAFSIPSITTDLAGFGVWAKEFSSNIIDGLSVIHRTDSNYHDVVTELKDVIISFVNLDETATNEARKKAFNLSQKALWSELIEPYFEAYSLAIKKAGKRIIKQSRKSHNLPHMKIDVCHTNMPEWKEISVKSRLPEELIGLVEISRNLWNVWNYKATDLFRKINKERWDQLKDNPIKFLETISYEEYNNLLSDKDYMAFYKEVYDSFKDYMAAKTTHTGPQIAYFSMEFGLTDYLKIYSGGLGILAGDYLKEASDCNANMVAVGLLYRNGYFTQALSISGEQQAIYEPQNFGMLPIKLMKDENNAPIQIKLHFPGRDVTASIWRVQVGRVDLFLLDTDLYENQEQDRSITAQLYGGDWENRLKQEILLGFGGIRALEKLGFKPDVYHCNEGHAAFINIQRLERYIANEKLTFEDALEVVRSSSLFTTHTPVPAGHDSFDEEILRVYLRHIPESLHISWEDFMMLGKEMPYNAGDRFSMSILAARTSQEMNGVSKLHGEVSRDMFQKLWKGYFASELHIGHVTNGVHYGTWTSKDWRKVYEANFGDEFLSDQSNPKHWEKIYDLSDELVWNTKQGLKSRLMKYIKYRFEKDWLEKQGDPSRVVSVLENISDKALTIGFARRFATYKRAHLLFNDIDRLKRILNNPDRPVQFLFAGKAHPADGGGQGLIKHIVELSKLPEFEGKIIFLENYDMLLAKRLVSGVDIWLNTPTRPLEASGTSGEKAQMNGTLNFSVLDGWWLEGFRKGAGWALTEKRTYEKQDFQDELDASTIYSILEHEIIPLYYEKNEEGFNPEWVRVIKNSIAQIAPHYTTKRMFDDYSHQYYVPLFERTVNLQKNEFEKAIELSDWKKFVASEWEAISAIDINFDEINRELAFGDRPTVTLKLHTGELSYSDIGVELVTLLKNEKNGVDLIATREMEVVSSDETTVDYKLDYVITTPGNFRYALRVFPKHKYLPHRQSFCYTKWL